MQLQQLQALLEDHSELKDGQTWYLVPAQWYRSLFAFLETEAGGSPPGLIPTCTLLPDEDEQESPPSEPEGSEWTCRHCNATLPATAFQCDACRSDDVRIASDKRVSTAQFYDRHGHPEDADDDGPQLRPRLVQPDDVIAVSPAVWACLLSEFGVDGPVIGRPVVSSPISRKKKWVDLYPVTLWALSLEASHASALYGDGAEAEADVPTKLSVGRYQSFRQMCAVLGLATGLPYHKLIVMQSSPPPPGGVCRFEMIRADSKTSVEELGVADGRPRLFLCTAENAALPTASSSSYGGGGRYSSGGYYDVAVKGTPAAPGLAGIANVGNTCFMASALQALSNSIPVADLFATDAYAASVNVTNKLGSKGEVSELFSLLLKDLWGGELTVVNPRKLKAAIARRAPQFVGYQQQDAHELLAFVLDTLHEDLRRVPEGGGEHGQGGSLVADLARTHLKSVVRCPSEGCAPAERSEPCLWLSLPLPQSENRVVCMTVVPWWGNEACEAAAPTALQRYGVVVPANGTIAEARAAVAALAGLPASNLAVAEVFRHRVVRVRGMAERLDTVSHSDYLVAYEVPASVLADGAPCASAGGLDDPQVSTPPQLVRERSFPENIAFLQVLMRRHGGASLFGFPLLVPISIDDGSLTEAAARQLALHPFCSQWADMAAVEVRLLEGVEELRSLQVGATTPLQVDVMRNQLAVDWPATVLESAKGKAHPHLLPLSKGVSEHESVAAALEAAAITTSVDACLGEFLAPELLHEAFECGTCHERVFGAEKQLQLDPSESLPPLLFIHLKRLTHTGAFRVKLTANVAFPLRDLRLPGAEGGPAYHLYAVVNHLGGAHGGHYTTSALSRNTGEWYSFNDSRVTPLASTDELASADAYILCYEREDVAALRGSDSFLQAASSSSLASSSATSSPSPSSPERATADDAAGATAPAPPLPTPTPMELDDEWTGLQAAGTAPLVDDWACAACTFVNDGSNGGISCEMCNSPGPLSGSAAPAGSEENPLIGP